jgi:predicted acylesterase/phospholipase RssA
MAKMGLALSGGGFRGTLFHLGVVRFLRDAGVLRDVTHITSVSGGSILAAHLVLNWERYNLRAVWPVRTSQNVPEQTARERRTWGAASRS